MQTQIALASCTFDIEQVLPSVTRLSGCPSLAYRDADVMTIEALTENKENLESAVALEANVRLVPSYVRYLPP